MKKVISQTSLFLAFLFFLGFAIDVKATPCPMQAPQCTYYPQQCMPIPGADPKKCGDTESSTTISEPFRCADTPVYKCTNNSCGTDGGAITSGTMYYKCRTTMYYSWSSCFACSAGQTCVVSGPYGPENINTDYKKVSDYRICPAAYNDWGVCDPVQECKGKCYPEPETKSLSDSSIYPGNKSDEVGYKLPINFGWQDLEKVVNTDDSYCTVGSYKFNIGNITKVVAGRTELQSSTTEPYELECDLKRETSYQWKVSGCLDAGGADCGKWSSLQPVKTSSAPELYSPYDKDWMETEGAVANFSDLTLNWCETKFPVAGEEDQLPLSFLIRFYLVKDGKDSAHPDFTDGEPFIMSIDPRQGRPPEQTYSDGNYNHFTKGYTYAWEVATCKDSAYSDCTEYSQRWRFSLEDFVMEKAIPSYPPNDPSGNTPVGVPVTLQWSIPYGAESYVYSLDGVKEGKTKDSSVTFSSLSLNKMYSWKVKTCQDQEGNTCEDWSETYHFKTTGQAPVLSSPSGNNVTIPTEFKWSAVPGAKSYVFVLTGGGVNEQITTEETSLTFEYPDIKQENSYAWQVKTCAGADGKICGSNSSPLSFTTAKMPSPAVLAPLTNGKVYASQVGNSLKWGSVPGANYYQYELNYTALSNLEVNENCVTGAQRYGITTSLQPSIPLELTCLGDYEWRARGCYDLNCTEAGTWTEMTKFSFVDEDANPSYGLVPCGKISDNPETNWNERDKCEVKHIFLLIRNIIDFILWTFAPLMLGILVMGTGIMFYFSIRFQNSEFLAKVKTTWKYAGIGYGILFFSWVVLNIFLSLIGFQVGIFGNWWQAGF